MLDGDRFIAARLLKRDFFVTLLSCQNRVS